MLQIFDDATKYFSRGIPTIAKVIPAMDQFEEALSADIDNTKYHPAVREAARQGRKLMNKYYGRTDESEIYRIVMRTSISTRIR